MRLSACVNATARYSLAAPGEIEVVNRCERRTPSGEPVEDEAEGLARVRDDSGRKLEVAFGPGVARFFQRLFAGSDGNYWIYCLGPVNGEGLYAWSVVSGPERDYIFVLTRQPSAEGALPKPMLDCARREGLPLDRLKYARE